MRIHDYNSANEFSKGRKRKLANNTYFEILPTNNQTGLPDFGVRLHNTIIITWTADGKTILNSGGWQTVTTKERINRYMPDGFTLWQEKGIWFIGAPWNSKEKESVAFQDGIYFQKGKWHNCGTDPRITIRLRNKVKSYAKVFTRKIFAGEIEKPSGGDCWICLLFNQNPNHKDSEHIRNHIDQKYYVPTLALLAVKRFGSIMAHDIVLAHLCPDLDGAESLRNSYLCKDGFMQKQIESAIKRHCLAQLGLPT
jgi:hypothetical protein